MDWLGKFIREKMPLIIIGWYEIGCSEYFRNNIAHGLDSIHAIMGSASVRSISVESLSNLFQ